MPKKILMILFFILWAVPALADMVVDTAWARCKLQNGYDFARAIAIDHLNNVYVSGASGTVKYDAKGNELWSGVWGGEDIAVDDSGNVYVAGTIFDPVTYDDYATVKYYPNGDTAWLRTYHGYLNGRDEAFAIAVDSSGNVYVTGRSWGSGTYDDYATIKYNRDGDTCWARRYNGPGNAGDGSSAIAVDDSGNVYVTGSSTGSGTSSDYATIKYYANGDTVWVRRYNGPGNSSDNAFALTVDDSGYVYVTGYSEGSGTSYDYATIKYTPEGDTAWVRRYNGPGNGNDGARAIAVDGSGNVYVTGGSVGSGTSGDYATIKYYPTGDTAWVRRYNGPGNSGDEAYAIAVDGSNNVYVTGDSYSGTGGDYTTIRYDPNGDTGWVRRYIGGGWGATAIALDDANNVYATGSTWCSGSDIDYTTIKYFQALRGDVNSDGVIDISDVVYLINYLFIDGPAPVPILKVGDVNCDGNVNASDVVYLINYLFINGPPPGC
jgi:hypothetical protein